MCRVEFNMDSVRLLCHVYLKEKEIWYYESKTLRNIYDEIGELNFRLASLEYQISTTINDSLFYYFYSLFYNNM